MRVIKERNALFLGLTNKKRRVLFKERNVLFENMTFFNPKKNIKKTLRSIKQKRLRIKVAFLVSNLKFFYNLIIVF